METLRPNNRRTITKYLSLIIVACAVTFFLQISFVYVDSAQHSLEVGVDNFFLNLLFVLQISANPQFPLNILLIAIIFLVFNRFLTVKHIARFSVISLLLSLLFMFIVCVGRVIETTMFTSAAIDPYSTAKLLLFAVALLVVLYPALIVIEDLIVGFLKKRPAGAESVDIRGRFSQWLFARRPFIGPLIIILICWLPYLVFCFPGTTDPIDNLDQLNQYHGIVYRTSTWVNLVDPNVLLNNNNPILHTVLLNLFIDFGGQVGSQNLGLFLFVLMQTLLFSSGLAATISFQARLKTPRGVRAAMLLGYALIPLFPGWTVCVTKDVIFTGLVIWYVLLLAEGVRRPDTFREKKRLVFAFLVVSLLMTLVRGNGIFMLLFSAPLLFFVRKAGARIVAATSVVSIVCYFAYSSLLLPALHVTPGGIQEALSIPFQQTANYVVSHPDDIGPEEKEAIAKVLDYPNLAANYYPFQSDNIIHSYNKDATREDLMEYFKVWFSMGLRHPNTYLMATLPNSYSYFYPGSDGSWVWLKLNHWGRYDAGGVDADYHASGFHMEQVPEFDTARDLLREGFYFFRSTPFGLAVNMGFCAWIILFSTALLLKHRRWRGIIAFMPILMLLLICLASPLNGSIRYALPYISATPLLVTLMLYLVREKEQQAKGASVVLVSEDESRAFALEGEPVVSIPFPSPEQESARLS